MSQKTLIITRPVAQAHAFAERMRVAGREVEIFPLLEIQPLDDNSEVARVVANLNRFSMVAFVSPNAISVFFQHIKVWPKAIPIAVVGEGSRKALEAFGLNRDTATIISPGNLMKTDSETLLDEIDCDSLAGKTVLIVRATSGREFLADALRSKAIAVEQLAVYRRTAPDLTPDKQRRLEAILSADCDWVISSSEALRTLDHWCRLSNDPECVVKMQRQSIYVPHIRIAQTAESLGFVSITLTASGDEHMFVALQSQV